MLLLWVVQKWNPLGTVKRLLRGVITSLVAPHVIGTTAFFQQAQSPCNPIIIECFQITSHSLIVVINLLNSLGCSISLLRFTIRPLMAPTHSNSTSASNPAKEDDCRIHLPVCTGPGLEGKNCIIWTNTKVSKLIPKTFIARLFFCGFCAFEELQKMKRPTVENLLPINDTDNFEQSGWRENARIFGVEEEPDENVFAKVVSVIEKAGVTITAYDVSASHRLMGRSKGPKLLNSKFVRLDTKHQLMKLKKNLRETSTCVNDDCTSFKIGIISCFLMCARVSRNMFCEILGYFTRFLSF